MHIGKTTKFKIPSLREFDFQIKLSETNRSIHTNGIEFHTHNEFELYINLSGDVSFLVENNLYDLTRGDVIIARPGVYHHCVYRSDAPHKLFWILFDCQKNKDILEFLGDGFRENYISPRDDLREELLTLCYSLHGDILTDEEKIYTFFRISAILKQSKSHISEKSALSKDLHKMIDYINHHIYEEITVGEIAKALYISQSTLERRFKEFLGATPSEYVRRRKLMLAAELLQSGESVLNAGTAVGYNDNSFFIELFKRYYGVTPYQYKKNYTKSNQAR